MGDLDRPRTPHGPIRGRPGAAKRASHQRWGGTTTRSRRGVLLGTQQRRGRSGGAGREAVVDIDEEAAWLNVDRRALNQILINLLWNAFKFTPAGKRVGLRARLSEEGGVDVAVWDEGIGISPDKIEEVRKPFVQVESSLAKRYDGAGLGLAIVESLARAHGAELRIESVEGEGSTFTIRLPRTVQTEEERLKLVHPIAEDAEEPLILVVDDDATVRELVDTFAAHLGKRVVWVPLPLGLTRAAVSLPMMERLMGLPVEALDYFASPTTYDTSHVEADLVGTGLTCPRFEDYAPRLLAYMAGHPEHDAAAMV